MFHGMTRNGLVLFEGNFVVFATFGIYSDHYTDYSYNFTLPCVQCYPFFSQSGLVTLENIGG